MFQKCTFKKFLPFKFKIAFFWPKMFFEMAVLPSSYYKFQ